jgi:hypothetical protein
MVPDIPLRPLVTLIEGDKRRSAVGRLRTLQVGLQPAKSRHAVRP